MRNFKGSQKDTMRTLGKSKTYKLMRINQKLYKQLCNKCKLLAGHIDWKTKTLRIGNMETMYDNLCDECKAKADKLMGDL